MTDLTGSRETQLLNDIVPAGGVYVALHTSDPGNDPDGTTELSAGGYSRVLVAQADWTISGSGPTNLTNDVSIEFGPATANWPEVTHISLWEGDTTSDPVNVAGDLTTPRTVNENDELHINAGNLNLNVN